MTGEYALSQNLLGGARAFQTNDESMSRQKDRRWKRTPRQDVVVASIRKVADLPFVTEVEDHFAEMWNELGIQIKVIVGATDCEVIGLRNKVLKCLGDINQETKLPFTWIVGFWRNGKNIEVLFPQDDVKSEGDTLRVV